VTLVLCAALPLLAAAIIAVAGGVIGRRGAAAISSAALALAFGACLAIGQAFAAGKASLVAEIGPWLPVRGGDLALGVDATTLPLLIATTFVSAIIAIGSWRAPQTAAYHVAILLGTGALVVTFTAANLGLFAAAFGLLSAAAYIARSHDHERASAAAGAEGAFVVDRLGDAAFLLATLGYLALFRTLDLTEIATRVVAPRVADAPFIVPSALLCGAVLAKSAQLPFHAKAAGLRETPLGLATFGALTFTASAVALVRVSALLHPGVLAAAAALGALTAIVGAVLAITRARGRDALAWSAVVPAGIVIVGVGAGANGLALAVFVATTLVFVAITTVAAIGRPRLRWRGAGSSRMRGAVTNGLGLLALRTAMARGYAAVAQTLEGGTDVSIDRAITYFAASTLRVGRIVAHAEAGPAWRLEAVGLAALIALVAYWTLR
jgi:NADH:ubiquinone oxidoreductase subunit 5 (subunit L)/multisubunit Na+/H+ antiporter MnhA subunit